MGGEKLLSNDPNVVVLDRSPTILHKADNHSVVINIPKHFYGSEIKANNLTLKDNDIPGTLGNISITLKDNGKSGLYRADCLTTQATWNTVGNVLYNDGAVIIFHPSLYCHFRILHHYHQVLQL